MVGKVVREGRLRVSEAGAAFDAHEIEQWESQEAIYFGKRSAPVTGESEKKRAKKAEQELRLSSLDVANAWQNMVMQHYGQHCGDFPSASTKVFVLVLDECSKNTCPFYFLRNKKKVGVEAVFDNFHRRAPTL